MTVLANRERKQKKRDGELDPVSNLSDSPAPSIGEKNEKSLSSEVNTVEIWNGNVTKRPISSKIKTLLQYWKVWLSPRFIEMDLRTPVAYVRLSL